jgi:TPP-dependent 2-oxoacid decarboxylase
METSEIKKKLHEYIESAEEEKVKAIYTVLESDIENAVYDHWNDPDFVAEMDSRMKSIEDGTAKTVTMEEMFSQMDKIIKGSKQKDAV